MFLNDVYITGHEYVPVHLALGYSLDSKERWYVASDESVIPETFVEYGFRFGIEENFLDDKSNGFQLEDSKMRSAGELERLFFVIAVATLYLVSQGVEVVSKDKRRYLDPHWFRGSSYLKIGWNWVKTVLNKGWRLCSRLRLIVGIDPEPVISSLVTSKRIHAFSQMVIINNSP